MRRQTQGVLGLLVSLIGAANAAGLDGTEVTTTAYCCTSPTESNRFTVPLTRTVGPGVEYPSGTIQTLSGLQIISSSIDVSTTTIELNYTQSSATAGGTFNGYVFSFTGPAFTAFTAVSLNPSSTFIPTGLSFDSDSIFYNAAGKFITLGDKVVIDVTLAPVPEPAASLLWLSGIAGLLVSRRVRLRRARPGIGA